MSSHQQVITKLTPPISKTLPGYTEVSDPVYYDPLNKVFTVGERAEFEPISDNWSLEHGGMGIQTKGNQVSRCRQ